MAVESTVELPAGRAARNLNLDLVRCWAVFSVVSVHFFINSEFFSDYISGGTMLVGMLARTVFMVCVPLFALLTGYLCGNKELNRQYFKRILPILSTYLWAAIFSIVYRNCVKHEGISLAYAVLLILDVQGGADGYSWYVNMYIGLFLLIPFLNVLYHGLKSRRQKQALLGVLLFMTAAPSVFNSIGWGTPGFWAMPSTAGTLYPMVPNYWEGLWPLTYYFIGVYLKEYDLPLTLRQVVPLYLGATLGMGLYIYYRSRGSLEPYTFSRYFWGSFGYVLQSVLAFVLLLRLNLARLPNWGGRLITWISKRALGIYLCSYITDQVVYPWLNGQNLPIRKQLLCAPLMVISSFILALAMSQLIAWIEAGLRWLVRKGKRLL